MASSAPVSSPEAKRPPIISSDNGDRSPRSNGTNHAQGSVSRTLTNRESDRERARREAKECLQAVQYEGFQLDGFNLLGVVANPRAGMVGSRHTTTNSPPRHAGQNRQGMSDSSSGAGAGAQASEQSSDYFSGAVHSLESTLGQVTEQIETLNLFLEELSRQYLGDDGGESLFLEYYYQEDEEQAEMPPVPPRLANLQLTELQAYLEKCGVLAHSLFSQGLETSSLPSPPPASNGEGSLATKGPLVAVQEEEMAEIPEIFFENDFDLTQSETFVQLLSQIGDDEERSVVSNGPAKTNCNSLFQPTSQLIPVREQDALAGYLDKVELALQEQVRLKAGAFFQETNRFRLLQSSIEELLDQVKILRHGIQSILSVYRQTKDISNHQRQDYELLVQLMDTTMDLIQTKSSIGGLLSANDHIGVVQQIQYGRMLLRGSVDLPTDVSDEGLHKSASLELQKVIALSSCGEQFQQYESLVVRNLSEEIVDIFFNWRPSEKDRVHEMAQSLMLCKAFDKAGELYNRRLQQTIRMTVRTTIAEFVDVSGSNGSGVTGMTYSDFFKCLELLIEELQSLLEMSRQVDVFAAEDALFAEAEKRWTQDAMTTGADLAAKSIAELLRLRKEAHSLINFDEMRQLWDTCLKFTLTVEGYGNDVKAVGLRSTLVGQAKAFLDRTHESNMSALVAALDSERWTPCEVSAERQAALTRLCTGRAVLAVKRQHDDGTVDSTSQKKPIAEVEGVHYKVVWSSLVLVEMVMINLQAAGHFHSLATNAVTKVAELLRLFNSRATNLVLGAGAIHAAAKLKSINAKHLSMVTQCLGMITSLLPHIRAALMAQLPSKQHALLNDLDKIKKDYTDHSEKVLNKFVTIIGGIVEHALAPKIENTDFDARARDLPSTTDELDCCIFLDGISTNTRKMHQVLSAMLPPDHLQDVFSRIFAYLDQKVPTLLIAACAQGSNGSTKFRFPTTDEGKRRLLLEVESMTIKLNELDGVLPWDFTCTNVLERKLDFNLVEKPTLSDPELADESAGGETPSSPTSQLEKGIEALDDANGVAEIYIEDSGGEENQTTDSDKIDEA